MQKKLLTNGNAFKRTDGRWCGVVWYMDESGERKRKSFSGTTKQEVNKKMTEPEELTAANASVPRKRPTISESAVLYSCWKIWLKRSGNAKLMIREYGFPVVRSLVCAPRALTDCIRIIFLYVKRPCRIVFKST